VILYFLRHGDAGDPRPTDDDARELTKKGVKQLRAGVPVWRRLKLRPDAVITSPLPRARQTAEIFCEGLALARPIDDPRLRPGADWAAFKHALADHPDAQRVAFVGHEPDLSRAMTLLSGAHAIRLRKAGVGCLEFAGAPERRAGDIAWLIDPDLYAEA
jgi:phosphohistidine phosphatase